jgi:hypothetical protein
VGHADGVDPERPRLDHLAGGEGAEVGFDGPLAEPVRHEAQREPRAVDRRRRRLEGERQRADVVFVAVGEHDGADAGGPLRDVLEVGDDRVDPRKLGPGEHHAGIEEQDVVPPLHDQGVQAKLSQAT